jgi:hypothetical protein
MARTQTASRVTASAFGDNSAKAGDKIAPDEAWKNLVANIRLARRLLTAR